MSIHVTASIVAATILALIMILQVLLAAGFPLGQVAWGGRYRVLPMRLRLGSLAAVFLLGGGGWILLARASLVVPGAEVPLVRVGTWVFAGYFALNSVGNAASQSRMERAVMTPLSLITTACFFVVALS